MLIFGREEEKNKRRKNIEELIAYIILYAAIGGTLSLVFNITWLQGIVVVAAFNILVKI